MKNRLMKYQEDEDITWSSYAIFVNNSDIGEIYNYWFAFKVNISIFEITKISLWGNYLR